MSREFLGQGWAFPIRFREDGGGPAFSKHEQGIVEAVRLILGTRPGERVMLPTFGCPLDELAFAPLDASTFTAAEAMVRAALQRWEPRIDVGVVEATAATQPRGGLRLRIEWVVRRSNNHQNLVHLADLRSFHGAH